MVALLLLVVVVVLLLVAGRGGGCVLPTVFDELWALDTDGKGQSSGSGGCAAVAGGCRGVY